MSGRPARRLRALPRAALGAARRRRQLDARASRFRQPDGDRLLGRPGAVFALANVVDLLAYEFARLRAGRLALPFVASGARECRFLRHSSPPSLEFVVALPRQPAAADDPIVLLNPATP